MKTQRRKSRFDATIAASDFEKLYCNQIVTGILQHGFAAYENPQTTVRTRKLTEDVLKTLNAKLKKRVRSRKKIVFPDGNIYEGDTVHEVLDGEGEMTFKNGTRQYTLAVFEIPRKYGYGKPEGFKYVRGSVESWQETRESEYRFISGSVIDDGEFKDGKKDGKGKYIENRNVYDGEWVSGKRHGHGKYTWADGRVYVGEFKDDKQYGKGEYT